MPRRNGTGPMGQGASTGRGLGPCESGRGRCNQSFNRGMGMGGRKRRNGFGANFNEDVTKEDIALQITQLKEEITKLEQSLNTI